MQAYYIKYSIRGKDGIKEASVDAKDSNSAKNKIGKRNGYKDGRMIQIKECKVIGYY